MKLLSLFWRDQRGSVIVYSAIFSLLALSAGSVAIDLGRLVTLKAQMQYRADASAIAGAAYLDGTSGARTRAEDVAKNASTDTSNITSADSTSLTVSTVNFYSAYTSSSDNTVATTDINAEIIEVILTPKLIDFFFTPFLGMIVGTASASSFTDVNASAVAQSGPLMCSNPPPDDVRPRRDRWPGRSGFQQCRAPGRPENPGTQRPLGTW